MTNVSIEENVVIYNIRGRELTVDIFTTSEYPGSGLGPALFAWGWVANRQPCALERALRDSDGPAWLRLCRRGVPRDG